MTKAITTTNMMESLDDVARLANALAKSGFYKDIRDAAQGTIKMLAAMELGISPIRGASEIIIVDGKITLSASLIASLIKGSEKYTYKTIVRDNELCTLEFFEGEESLGVSEFSIGDAKRAGLANKQNWSKYPRAMLFARALTEGARVYCPDVFGGAIYVPEELEREEKDVSAPKAGSLDFGPRKPELPQGGKEAPVKEPDEVLPPEEEITSMEDVINDKPKKKAAKKKAAAKKKPETGNELVDDAAKEYDAQKKEAEANGGGTGIPEETRKRLIAMAKDRLEEIGHPMAGKPKDWLKEFVGKSTTMIFEHEVPDLCMKIKKFQLEDVPNE